ncbi:hypothetical protein CEXT_83981, partial [Caerostris extrusa]
ILTLDIHETLSVALYPRSLVDFSLPIPRGNKTKPRLSFLQSQPAGNESMFVVVIWVVLNLFERHLALPRITISSFPCCIQILAHASPIVAIVAALLKGAVTSANT